MIYVRWPVSSLAHIRCLIKSLPSEYGPRKVRTGALVLFSGPSQSGQNKIVCAGKTALPTTGPPTKKIRLSLKGPTLRHNSWGSKTSQMKPVHQDSEFKGVQFATPLTPQPLPTQPYPTFPESHTNLPFDGRGKISSSLRGVQILSLLPFSQQLFKKSHFIIKMENLQSCSKGYSMEQ